MKNIINQYDLSKITIAVLGSHSALDVCSGAKKLGFKTLVIAQKGRDSVYSKYYKTRDNIGCVDNCLILDKFSDLLKPEIQQQLIQPKRYFYSSSLFSSLFKF
jgi:5-formaminoimidazole-4-carboxamide-1-(beta)-D-ribofuranosyl 5'-monophosphate synthetase